MFKRFAKLVSIFAFSVGLYGGTPPGMVLIPDGSYVPLYIDEAEARNVSAFYLDERQVTNGEYLDFVIKNPQWRRSNVKRLFADDAYLSHWAGDTDLGSAAKEIKNSPVTNVSWFAARAYLKAQGKRLPTEDELDAREGKKKEKGEGS